MDDDPPEQVLLIADHWPGREDELGLFLRAAKAALAFASADAEVTIRLDTDESVRALNRQFRGKDRPTNVLSFPAAPASAPPGERAALGDIILAQETLAREAAEQGKPLAHHGAHLVVHAILHLAGYDHQTDDDALAMEDAERQILSRLGIADPYLIADPLE